VKIYICRMASCGGLFERNAMIFDLDEGAFEVYR